MLAPQVLGYRTFPFQGEGNPLQFPVVLVRGLGRSSGFWLEFIDALTPWAKVVTVDLYGTGLSPSKTGRGSIEALAADVVATLEHEGLQRCHLVGISLGGMVCVEAASRPSLGLASLSVLASSARFTKERRIAPRAVAELLYALRKPIPSNGEFARWLVSQETLKNRPELPAIWDDIWRREGFQKLAVIRQLLAAALFDGRAALDALSLPVCFVVSRDDGLVDWRNSLKLWERVEGSRLHVLSGPGHDFPTERPDETASLLVSFFRQIESRTFVNDSRKNLFPSI
jgi:pimeloyl-ACP methyl ester carboxylesterase